MLAAVRAARSLATNKIVYAVSRAARSLATLQFRLGVSIFTILRKKKKDIICNNFLTKDRKLRDLYIFI